MHCECTASTACALHIGMRMHNGIRIHAHAQAGFSEESTAPHDAHPMLDSRRSGQGGHLLGKGEEERLMVGILLWRT